MLGSCDPQTGQCINPAAPDGTACANGSCQGGVCEEQAAGEQEEDPSCGCRAVGRHSRGGSGWLALLGLAALLTRRSAAKGRTIPAPPTPTSPPWSFPWTSWRELVAGLRVRQLQHRVVQELIAPDVKVQPTARQWTVRVRQGKPDPAP